MNRFCQLRTLRIASPAGYGPQTRCLRCSFLTYRTGYASSLAPRQQTLGPGAECELISLVEFLIDSSLGQDLEYAPLPQRSLNRLDRIADLKDGRLA